VRDVRTNAMERLSNIRQLFNGFEDDLVSIYFVQNLQGCLICVTLYDF
jgi:hypothetical protein